MPQPTIEFAIAERDKCLEYLNGEGPDKLGAWMGWRDWTVEIALLSHDAAITASARR